MPIRMTTHAPDFAERFRGFLAAKRELSEDVSAAAQAIVADVIARGDAALVALSRRFDRVDLDAVGMRVSADEIDRAVHDCDADSLEALGFAKVRIEAYHRRQIPANDHFVPNSDCGGPR
jgi:histidinol dehydrogenase